MQRAIIITVLAIVCAACSYTPTQPSPFTSPTTQTLSGTVYPSGTTTTWLSVTHAGTLSAALVSAEPATVLGMSLGMLSGGHCDPLQRTDAHPGSGPQIVMATEAGMYCLEVSDLGSAPLSGVTYSVSVGFY